MDCDDKILRAIHQSQDDTCMSSHDFVALISVTVMLHGCDLCVLNEHSTSTRSFFVAISALPPASRQSIRKALSLKSSVSIDAVSTDGVKDAWPAAEGLGSRSGWELGRLLLVVRLQLFDVCWPPLN